MSHPGQECDSRPHPKQGEGGLDYGSPDHYGRENQHAPGCKAEGCGE